MKKNDLLLLLAVASYSYLFYDQTPGLNLLLFNLFLILVLIIRNGDRPGFYSIPWLLSALGTLISSVAVVLYGNSLSVIASLVSISLIGLYSIHPRTSVLLGGVYALYSYLSSVAMMWLDWISRRKNRATNTRTNAFSPIILIVPLLATLLFFGLYRASNPLFYNFTDHFNFDFISLAWVRFTLFGFILLYGYFYMRSIPFLESKDRNASSSLSKENFSTENNTLFGIKIALPTEVLTGICLFALLILQLLVVNVLDIRYLWLADTLPDTLSFSESVHQSIDTLILSICFAVAIILIVFRGNLNFSSSGKIIKLLAYIWIVQNCFMILSTALRNQLYINEYSLTYKRIGIYIYLLLCIAGLLTTVVKIIYHKSNWYLFRTNGWLVYGVLVLSSIFNWDGFITKFNLHNSKTLDYAYLINLPAGNTATLLRNTAATEQSPELLQNLHLKTFRFLSHYAPKEWQSWNFADQKTNQEIVQLEKEGKIKNLYLPNSGIQSMEPMKEWGQLESLTLSGNHFQALQQLHYFPLLKSLSLDANQIEQLKDLPALPQLLYLSLANNKVSDYSALANTPLLIELYLHNNGLSQLHTLPTLKYLEVLDLSDNALQSLSSLKKYPNLQHLKINKMADLNYSTIPSLAKLQILEVRNAFVYGQQQLFSSLLERLPALTSLDVSNNKLHNLYFIDRTVFEKQKLSLQDKPVPLPASLEVLDITQNDLISLMGIEHLDALQNLQASHNRIASIAPLATCTALTELALNNNYISALPDLSKLTRLHTLDLSYNKIANLGNTTLPKSIEVLYLTGNKITDPTPLAQLTALRILHMSGNTAITNWSFLKSIPLLETLHLSVPDPQNFDWSILASLPNLSNLYCENMNKDTADKIRTQFPGLKTVHSSNQAEVVYDTTY
jgi:Leucine-rich repeat (LRR) protein